MTLFQRVGAGLKALRMSRGISQAKLAEWIGVEPDTISRYERTFREPNFDTIEQILDKLDSSPALFFPALFIEEATNTHPDVCSLVAFAVTLSASEARSSLAMAQIHVAEVRCSVAEVSGVFALSR